MRPKKGDIETNYDVRSFDRDIPLDEYQKLPKNPLYVILDNVRSAFNVGGIFRICDALRVSGLFLCGYTAYPPHGKLAKTSLGAIDYVPWQHFETAVDAVRHLKDRGIPTWAAETTSRSQDYSRIDYPRPLGVVFGNETLGVQRPVLDGCDAIVEIPLNGYKNSLNVMTSCAVIGFRALESWGREGATGRH